MNREIKFRFIYGIDGEENTYFSKVFTFSEIENGCHWEWLCDNPLYRNYSILAKHQFTGLLDKHGNEIYEGDILKKTYAATARTFSVSYHEERAAFIAQDGFNNLLFESYLHICEIIGNIYENPELLEDK